MSQLPLIVGFGGYSSAGRSSFDHAYIRTVLDALPERQIESTLVGLATMMGLVKHNGTNFEDTDGNHLSAPEVVHQYKQTILEGTLIRKLDADRKATICSERSDVNSAGQLPTGFDPADYYASKQHPRGIQMTILAVSDAIMSLGIPWQKIVDHTDPGEISVYAGSVMSQLDEHGYGNMMQASLKGKRVRARNLPLGLTSMPADFINAYVIGSLGKTGGTAGACATFLYNLDRAVKDIQSGDCKVAIVGNSEAPLTPEIFEGYAAMGALASDTKLKEIQNSDVVDHRSASRPFGENCGFTLAESAQYLILMNDELALELGASIHGSVGEVFVAADGYKSSISGPGPGNYLTMAKAVVSAKKAVGEESVCNRSFVQAHGSSTPQNRVTESQILSKVASSLGIESWPVTAI